MVKHAVWPPSPQWAAGSVFHVAGAKYLFDSYGAFVRKEGIGMIPKEEEASPQETATAVLIFEDDDKVQERVVEAINKLFFAPPAATGKRNAARENLESLFEALIKSQSASSSEFRKLVVDSFAGEMREALSDITKEILQAEVRKEVEKYKQQFAEYFRRQQAVPKGPRR